MNLMIKGVPVAVHPILPGRAQVWAARGLYFKDTRTIQIDPTTKPADQADTLLHECIHAIWDLRKLSKRPTEERVADSLGTAFAELFRDNPSLLSMLAGALYHNVPIVT